MGIFRDFEKEVIQILGKSKIPEELLAAVLSSSELVSVEHTGVGYFLTVRHPRLSHERQVLSEPKVLGTLGEGSCGFVAFIEEGELCLECHSWGDESIPKDIREQVVRIEIAASQATPPDGASRRR